MNGLRKDAVQWCHVRLPAALLTQLSRRLKPNLKSSLNSRCRGKCPIKRDHELSDCGRKPKVQSRIRPACPESRRPAVHGGRWRSFIEFVGFCWAPQEGKICSRSGRDIAFDLKGDHLKSLENIARLHVGALFLPIASIDLKGQTSPDGVRPLAGRKYIISFNLMVQIPTLTFRVADRSEPGRYDNAITVTG